MFITSQDKSVQETAYQAKKQIPPLHVTTKGIEKRQSILNTTKAKGPDNIPKVVFKTCSKQLTLSLRHIFQVSIDTGKLPSDWRSANVTPVLKKGDSHLPENYRPVSLTCISCKQLEHIICKYILNHLENKKILTPLNHGFRSGF